MDSGLFSADASGNAYNYAICLYSDVAIWHLPFDFFFFLGVGVRQLAINLMEKPGFSESFWVE